MEDLKYRIYDGRFIIEFNGRVDSENALGIEKSILKIVEGYSIRTK